MPRTLPRVVLAARSPHERQQQRAGIRLRDYSITETTRSRYTRAVAQLLPFLESQEDLHELDWIICDWIEYQWSKGTSVSDIADALSGLHFFWPEVRGRLRQSWRLFRNWRRIESPQRAPPLTALILRALVARAVLLGNVPFATLLCLGFHCMLRTGELLAIQYQDIEFDARCGVISLQASKSGLRTGAQEAVAVRDHLTLQVLDALFSLHHHGPGFRLWTFSAQCFREQLRSYLEFFEITHLGIKPYSLRRGGATFLLQEGVPLETILVRGRWRSLSVARLYLEDGLAQLPALRISSPCMQRILLFAAKTPATAFRP